MILYYFALIMGMEHLYANQESNADGFGFIFFFCFLSFFCLRYLCYHGRRLCISNTDFIEIAEEFLLC